MFGRISSRVRLFRQAKVIIRGAVKYEDYPPQIGILMMTIDRAESDSMSPIAAGSGQFYSSEPLLLLLNMAKVDSSPFLSGRSAGSGASRRGCY